MKEIGIIGSGTVGYATGKGFLSKGFRVTFFYDNDEEIIAQLKSEGYHAFHVEDLDLREKDIIFVSVPTPTVNGQFMAEYLISAISSIGVALKKEAISSTSQRYPVVAIRSTLLPGMTEREIISLLERTSGKKAKQDFGVCVNPAYLRERYAEEDPKAGDILEEIYKPFNCPIYRVPIKLAEFHKYVHNLFNATNFNEMRLVARAVNIDNASQVFELVAQSAEGMWNPIYGTRNWGPIGGSCLPKDCEAFLSFAEKVLNVDMLMLQATIKTNERLKKEYYSNDKPD